MVRGYTQATFLTQDSLQARPDGFFDGSKGGWRYISYRRPDTLQLIDDEATLRKFY